MIEITKDENSVYVSVNLPERKLSSDRKIKFTTVDAINEIKKKFPDLQFEKIPLKHEFADNRANKLEARWTFPVSKNEEHLQKQKKVLTTKKKNSNISKERKAKERPTNILEKLREEKKVSDSPETE